MRLYVIKRGPRGDFHKAPFHPVIICDLLKVARWQGGSTRDSAWVWESCELGKNDVNITGGMLLSRWNGFDIDYGHVVSSINMPDGTPGAFVHDRSLEPWNLLNGAVWWSVKPLPKALQSMGVIYPPDSFSRSSIMEDLDMLYPDKDFDIPEFWPPIIKPEGGGGIANS